MKKIHLLLSAMLASVLLILASIVPFNAVTLYTDGSYTYADIAEDYVALYAYDESTPTLVVPNNYLNRYVSSIYEYAFEDNETITAIDFSKSKKLSTIGLKSFASCVNLSGTLTLPNSVRSIGLGAFERCSSLNEVVINSSVQSIPQQCFNRCSSLSTVYLSPSVDLVGRRIIKNYGYLDDVYFTTTVNYISDTAFLNSNYVCFHVYYDSYAYHYAMDNNIPYVLIDKHNVIGDVNDDGVIDVFDANEIQKYAAEKTDFDDDTFYRADVNHDDYVNVIDALLIQKHVVGNYEIS